MYLTPALSALKARIGEFQTKWLMTDLDFCFNNSWSEVFGKQHRWLWCDWHCKRAWNKQLLAKSKRKVTNCVNKIDIMKINKLYPLFVN